MLQYLHLLELIIKYGNLRHSGYDFNTSRQETIERLGLANAPLTTTRHSSLKLLLWQNAFIRRLLSEAAFLKNSIPLTGGHLYDEKHNLAYIRIPKSASTSLSQVMLSACYHQLAEKIPTAEEINFVADNDLKRAVTIEKQATFFTVVRNPFARLVSVYRSFFEEKQDHFLYQDYLFGSLHQSISFREFVKRLSSIPDRLKDQHIKPQSMFLDYYERHEIKNIVVLKLEEPKQADLFLKQYELALPYLNKGKDNSDFWNYYDPETRRIAAYIYRNDLKRFGYASSI